QALRDKIRAERGEGEIFDFGPPLDEILARCQEETGLPAPVAPAPLPWAPMESAEEARERVRTHGDRQTTLTD
ncbi:MAG: hydantoinase B/oxoprolinase family protein, partial [Acidobacteriota bacterium]